MTIATYITFFRLFIGPLFFAVYRWPAFFGLDGVSTALALIAILAVSEFSDAADGYLARRFNQVTDLGKILDPMADSVSHTTIFLTFTEGPVGIPLPLVLIFFYRDALISSLRTICALRGFALAARNSGKVKAAIQGLVSLAILIMMGLEAIGEISLMSVHYAGVVLVSLAAIYAVYSAVDYLSANRHYIIRLMKVVSR